MYVKIIEVTKLKKL